MTGIYSHKLETGEYLPWTEHAQKVSDRALAIVQSKQFEFPSFDQADIMDSVHLCALFHDFGKGTRYFQIYLKNPPHQDLSQAFKREGLLPNETLKEHSLLSGLCAFKIAHDTFSDKPKNVMEQLASAIFLACVSHHSSLKSQGWVSETLNEIEDSTVDNLLHMYKAFYPPMFALSYMAVSGSKRIFNAQTVNNIDIKKTAIEARKVFTKIVSTRTTFEFNILAMFFYSIILESDKFWLITEKEESSIAPYGLDDSSVDRFRLKKFSNADKTLLNNMRNTAYQEVEDKLSSITSKEAKEGAFWTISLPTGLGKTLILANAGLKIAEKMVEAEMRPKIIVALPFLSIIEQSYKEYSNILGTSNILKYHSLSDLGTGNIADGTDRDIIKFHADIWNKPFIVTTFDQLLYAFLSEKKAFAARFHNLFNAVILLDEIQGIPYKAWTTFAEIANLLCKIGKSHIIVSSATCPDFEVPNTLHFIDEPKKYFKKLHRTKLIVENIDKAIEEEDILNFLNTLITGHPENSLLVILNTVRCAQKIYSDLRNVYIEKPIYTLTAALLPIHRTLIIEKVKEDLSAKKSPILIATQTVEAGVDLDFDITVRDIAPLDSIVQAAGRTNRNWKNIKEGHVYVICVKSKDKLQAHKIYGEDEGSHSIEVEATLNMLLRHKSKGLSEIAYLNLIEQYFKWLNEKARKDTDATSLNYALKKLSFDLQTKTIKQILRGEDEKNRIFLIHDEKSKGLLNRVFLVWTGVQKERFKINKWEMALLDVRGDIAGNTLGLYKWQIRSLPLQYIDPERELFPYIGVIGKEDIYQFDTESRSGVGLRYSYCKAKSPHTYIV